MTAQHAKKYTVAYQGIAGAYSHTAIEDVAAILKAPLLPQACPHFGALFAAIAKYGLGLVPIENSTAGSVSPCVDLLAQHLQYRIIAEYHFSVEHRLLAPKGVPLKNLTTVYSHPQALAQCSAFLERQGLQAVPFADTASSAQFVAQKQDGQSAAIASDHAGQLYDLTVVRKSIQNAANNMTRFFLVASSAQKAQRIQKTIIPAKKTYKSTIIFQTKDMPAALFKSLGGFATNGVNLTKIESRPSQEKNFDYFFFVDFEGHHDDPAVQRALEELAFFSRRVSFLGSYVQL